MLSECESDHSLGSTVYIERIFLVAHEPRSTARFEEQILIKPNTALVSVIELVAFGTVGICQDGVQDKASVVVIVSYVTGRVWLSIIPCGVVCLFGNYIPNEAGRLFHQVGVFVSSS
jgi:hypothetical protein